MQAVYQRPKALTDSYFRYCPGCGHSIITKLIAEIVDDQNLKEEVIAVYPIGCAVYANEYLNLDCICALHGRAPAVATGIKRSRPENLVLVYQGDGDMVAEGMSEIIHAAIRGEKLSVIFVNNAIFGMTGGQMAPTTLLGQVTTTSPYGRKKELTGAPVRMAELIGQIEGCIYSERVAVNNPKNIVQAKKAIERSFAYQIENRGLSFVEVISQCPTGWHMSPVRSLDWVENNMQEVFPLGKFKTPEVDQQ
jgi:2-oxoglutarate ferredoxin oxidoreductase subunit beta